MKCRPDLPRKDEKSWKVTLFDSPPSKETAKTMEGLKQNRPDLPRKDGKPWKVPISDSPPSTETPKTMEGLKQNHLDLFQNNHGGQLLENQEENYICL